MQKLCNINRLFLSTTKYLVSVLEKCQALIIVWKVKTKNERIRDHFTQKKELERSYIHPNEDTSISLSQTNWSSMQKHDN